jgi:hypothetical protein
MQRGLLSVAMGWFVLVSALPGTDTTKVGKPDDKVVAKPPEELNDKTLARWRDRIRPKAEELSVNSVKWLPTFWEAVIAAQKKDRPILLWAMNGHPLACT